MNKGSRRNMTARLSTLVFVLAIGAWILQRPMPNITPAFNLFDARTLARILGHLLPLSIMLELVLTIVIFLRRHINRLTRHNHKTAD